MYQRILDLARLLEKKSAINPLPETVGFSANSIKNVLLEAHLAV